MMDGSWSCYVGTGAGGAEGNVKELLSLGYLECL